MLRGQVEFDEVEHLAGQGAPQVPGDGVRDGNRYHAERDRPEVGVVARPGDRDVGDLPRVGRIAGILGMHERDRRLQVQRVDQVGLTLMQVHRTRVHRRRGPARPDPAQQPAGVGLQDGDLAAGGAADIDRRMRVDARTRVIPPPRRRSRPSSISDAATSWADHSAISASPIGNSVAAQRSWGPITYGLAGSITTRSTGSSSRADGWCTR